MLGSRNIPIFMILGALFAFNPAEAGSGTPRGRGPSGWQVFVIKTDTGTEYFVGRGGQRLKYSFDVTKASGRLATLDQLEDRLRALKRLNWVTVDQWNRGTPAAELSIIKQRIGSICENQKLGCIYSF